MNTFNLLAFRRRRWVLTGAIAALISGKEMHAANITWDGGGADDHWLAGANWDADIAPAINDALFFDGSIRLGPVNDYAAGALFNGLTFNAAAGAFTLSGTGLTLSPGISAGAGTVSGGNITNSSSNAETIALPLTLSAGNHTITTDAGSGVLNLNGAFQRNPGGTAVFAEGGGSINFSLSGLANDATAGGGLLGGWAITGPDWAALDGSKNIIAYSSYTTAETAIASDATQNVRVQSSSGNVTLVSTGITNINTLLYSGNIGKQTVEVGAGNVLRLGAQGGIYNAAPANGAARQLVIGASASSGGTLTAGGADNTPGEITFIDNNLTATVANNLTINSTIADNGGSSFPVRVNVLGYVVFANVANTYSGGTFINQGRFRAGNVASFGSGPVTIFPGAQTFLVAGGMWANNFFISGLGPAETDGAGITGPGAIRLNNTANITGTVTLQGSTRICTSSGANPQISGQITGTGPLEISSFATTNTNIMLANGSALNPNNWTGNVTISSLAGNRQVYVKLGANEQIPDTASVTINGTDIARLDLNGFSETFGALGSVASTNNQITNSGNSPSTLTLGSNNGTGVFAGTIQDGGASNAISLIKIGTGEQTLGGALNYTGATNILGGRLNVNSPLGFGSNVVNAAAGTTCFGVSQTLGVLNIGDGAIVDLGPPASPAPRFDEGIALASGDAPQAVPEPGAATLLLLGSLAALRSFRRRSG